MGKLWRKKLILKDKISLKSFFCPDEATFPFCDGFSCKKLPKPLAIFNYAIMHYVTLKDRVKVFYYYHFPILNHLYNKDCISFIYSSFTFHGGLYLEH